MLKKYVAGYMALVASLMVLNRVESLRKPLKRNGIMTHVCHAAQEAIAPLRVYIDRKSMLLEITFGNIMLISVSNTSVQ